MNTPSKPVDPPAKDTPPNPPHAPNGVPKGADAGEAKGSPGSGREQTEKAAGG